MLENNNIECLIEHLIFTVFVTRGTKSKASYSLPSNSTTTTNRFVQMNAALDERIFKKFVFFYFWKIIN